MKKISFLSLLLLGLCSACTDVIDIELDEGQTELVVDAFIDNLPRTQVIKLRYTAPYFSNEFAPTATGATVTVTNENGTTYDFKDENGDGNYTWEPPSDTETLGEIGLDFILTIELDGKTYEAFSRMNEVPPIDSITAEFRDDEFGQPDGYYAELRATDLPGKGNCYWIKAFKNGIFLNKPQEINLAFDASFTEGGNVDGVPFIQPIAEGINRIPDSGDDAEDNSDLPPYDLGDTIYVELHAITQETFYFMDEARTQLTLGDSGIFSEPSTNVPSNIVSSDSNEQPQGFFSVAAVSTAEKIVE